MLSGGKRKWNSELQTWAYVRTPAKKKTRVSLSIPAAKPDVLHPRGEEDYEEFDINPDAPVCAICLNRLREDCAILSQCDHMFCRGCISNWTQIQLASLLKKRQQEDRAAVDSGSSGLSGSLSRAHRVQSQRSVKNHSSEQPTSLPQPT